MPEPQNRMQQPTLYCGKIDEETLEWQQLAAWTKDVVTENVPPTITPERKKASVPVKILPKVSFYRSFWRKKTSHQQKKWGRPAIPVHRKNYVNQLPLRERWNFYPDDYVQQRYYALLEKGLEPYYQPHLQGRILLQCISTKSSVRITSQTMST